MDTSSIRPTTVVAITAGTIVTGFLAYAVYFDYRRRTDPAFRRALKRESKLQAKAEKDQKAAEVHKQQQVIRDIVQRVNSESLPKGELDGETFFMEQIALAEELAKDGIYHDIW
jgi:mitochondrial import receptor subunit TOM20